MDTRSQFVNSHALQTCLNPSENKLCSFVLSNCIFFFYLTHTSLIYTRWVSVAQSRRPTPTLFLIVLLSDISPYCLFFFNYPPGRNCGKIEKRKTNPEMGTCKWTVHFFFRTCKRFFETIQQWRTELRGFSHDATDTSWFNLMWQNGCMNQMAVAWQNRGNK